MAIYLLGGTSNAGKSTCAKRLAEDHGLRVLGFDDARGELQRDAALDHPVNWFLGGCRWLDLSPEEVLGHKIEVAQLTCDAKLDGLLAWIETEGVAAIIEGDDLLPSAVAQLIPSGRVAGAAFLIEHDIEVAQRRYFDRDRTCCIDRVPGRMARFLPHYRLWGDWLEDQARRFGLPTVPAQPYSDASDRVEAALGLPAR